MWRSRRIVEQPASEVFSEESIFESVDSLALYSQVPACAGGHPASWSYDSDTRKAQQFNKQRINEKGPDRARRKDSGGNY